MISFVLGAMTQSLTSRWAKTQHLGRTFKNSYQQNHVLTQVKEQLCRAEVPLQAVFCLSLKNVFCTGS